MLGHIVKRFDMPVTFHNGQDVRRLFRDTLTVATADPGAVPHSAARVPG